MRAHIRGWLVVVILGSVAAYALAEDLTLTTYYPSPRGVYKELRTQDTLVVGGVSHGPDGGALPAARLLVAGAGDPAVYGTLDPCPAGTAWFDDNPASGRDAYECRPPVIITPAGQVGIGTTSPDSTALLDVAGKIILSSSDPAQRTITNLTAPVDPTDAATRGWVLAQGGGGTKLVKNSGISTTPFTVDCGAGWQVIRCAWGQAGDCAPAATDVDRAERVAACAFAGIDESDPACPAQMYGGAGTPIGKVCDYSVFGSQVASVPTGFIPCATGRAIMALCAKQE